MHIVAPSVGENLPAGQFKHMPFEVALVLAEKVPANHAEHVKAPDVAEYFPAGQLEQAAPPALLLPEALYLPATHAVGTGHYKKQNTN